MGPFESAGFLKNQYYTSQQLQNVAKLCENDGYVKWCGLGQTLHGVFCHFSSNVSSFVLFLPLYTFIRSNFTYFVTIRVSSCWAFLLLRIPENSKTLHRNSKNSKNRNFKKPDTHVKFEIMHFSKLRGLGLQKKLLFLLFLLFMEQKPRNSGGSAVLKVTIFCSQNSNMALEQAGFWCSSVVSSVSGCGKPYTL